MNRGRVMKSFTIACSVNRVQGHQYFIVDAKTRDEAIKKFKAGESKFDYEEIEVTELGEPEVIEDD